MNEKKNIGLFYGGEATRLFIRRLCKEQSESEDFIATIAVLKERAEGKSQISAWGLTRDRGK